MWCESLAIAIMDQWATDFHMFSNPEQDCVGGRHELFCVILNRQCTYIAIICNSNVLKPQHVHIIITLFVCTSLLYYDHSLKLCAMILK